MLVKGEEETSSLIQSCGPELIGSRSGYETPRSQLCHVNANGQLSRYLSPALIRLALRSYWSPFTWSHRCR